ncbi:MAG: hypothetical protein IPN84_06040 [Sphingomonadales bacterium]|jgi:hypothetical protein|nr:hypothetical protein [Sphingomonadales bacterium]
MIDNFALGLTHFLMMLAALRLLMRRDLDKEAAPRHIDNAPKSFLGKRHA